MFNGKTVYDHLGNMYGSVQEMLDAYGIGRTTYGYRMSKGWTLEDVLTMPLYDSKRKPKKEPRVVRDHLGNEYGTIKEMCESYGIKQVTFTFRLKNGWPLDEALECPVGTPRQPVRDHLGNEYRSISEMCSVYGIATSTFSRRKGYGWTLEQVLTTKRYNACFDHLGNEYASIKEMCRHYGIAADVYSSRLENGYSVEEALTLPVLSPHKSKDHLGNEFPSFRAMCRAYGKNESTVSNRLEAGWSLERVLTEKPRRKTYF